MSSSSSSQICSLDPSAKPSLPPVLLPLVITLRTFALAEPSQHRRHVFFLLIATTSLWGLACTQIRAGGIDVVYGIASTLATMLFLSAVDILVTKPQMDVRLGALDKKIDDRNSEDNDPLATRSSSNDANQPLNNHKVSDVGVTNPQRPGDISSAPFLARLKWATSFWFNPRGIGYPQEPIRVLPQKPSPSTTRTAFLSQQFYFIVVHYAFLDIVLVAAHLYDSRRRWALAHGVFGRLDPWRLLSLSYGLQLYSMLALQHRFLAAAAVASGLSKPESWPALFHNVTEAYTLKRFWGKFWHQMLRRAFQATSSFIAHNLLGLPKAKSRCILFIKITLAFFVSALLHFGAEALVFQRIRSSGSLQFFAIQPVGLLIEDLASSMWRRFICQPRSFATSSTPVAFKLLGFVWVILWLALTFPPLADPLSEGGFIEAASIGLPSVIMGLWKGQWVWPAENRWVWEGI